ncbi:kinase-like domain-containing protein [Blastocladiella britannica]|nr:kinase-like domain-containing protein [Blastocladiella britannica]
MTSLWKRQSRSERDASYRRIAYQPNIGDYELLSPIGGVDDMSYLFLAIHKPTRTSVALKYTDLSISPDMAFIDELNTVVNNTMKYQHSSLLPYFQSFIENDRLWTVTLPMKAGSLRSVLEEYFPNGMSETAVVTVLKYLLRALDYLHDQGVIHNDVRADNLLLDFSGDVRLVGLHQISNLAEARPSAFDYVGMPAWMSPELFEQQVSFDPRSDIYSLGITAIELACGKTPYHEWPSLKIMVAKLKYLPPISEAEINKGKKRPYSKHFFSFVRSCLERDPASRPHAHELLQHPLMKRAKGASYLVSRLVKRTNLRHKYCTLFSEILLSPQVLRLTHEKI